MSETISATVVPRDPDSAFSAEDLAELHASYERIPSVECVGRCHDSCTSIDMSDLERRRLAPRGYTIPPRRTVEELAREKAATGRITRCPALSALGACRVYDARPVVCRAFGATQGLRCEHGCRPTSRSLTFRQFAALMLQVEALSDRVNGRAR